MFTRTTGWIIVPVWVVAMAWLVAHDVWPRWTAQDAPPLTVTEALRSDERITQQTIRDDAGRVGSIWTEYLIDPQSVRRTDTVYLERLSVPITPLRIIMDSVFTSEGILDEFTVLLENPDARLELHGERFHADFSFRLKWDTVEKLYKMPLSEGGLISGVVNPFSRLSGLRVGQRWRMQMFNPLAVLTGFGDRFTSVLVEVTGVEPLTVRGRTRDHFIVESPNARAWVAPDGSVPLQEVRLPFFGKLRISADEVVDEPRRVQASRGRLLRREKPFP